MSAQYKHVTENECALYFDSVEKANEYRDQYPESCAAGELVELDTDNTRLIFDNAGGVTLQLNGWAHYYNGNWEQLAHDLYTWINEGTATEWDGHEIEALDVDINSPYGYRWHDVGCVELIELIESLCGESWCPHELIKQLAQHL